MVIAKELYRSLILFYVKFIYFMRLNYLTNVFYTYIYKIYVYLILRIGIRHMLAVRKTCLHIFNRMLIKYNDALRKIVYCCDKHYYNYAYIYIYIHTIVYKLTSCNRGNRVAYPRLILAYYSFHLRVTFTEPFSITSDIDISNGIYYFRYYFLFSVVKY